MLAENNEYPPETSKTLFEMSEDEWVLEEQRYARRRRIKHENFLNNTIRELKHAIREKDAVMAVKDVQLSKLNVILEQEADIARFKALLAEEKSEKA